MNDFGKGVLLAFAAYIATMAVSVCLIVATVVVIMARSVDCSGMGSALLTLWSTIGAACVLSILAYAMLARKFLPDFTSRTWILAVYIVVVLASYLILAFGLMVLFNC